VKIHQFRTGNAQIIFRIENYRLFQQSGVESNIFITRKKQRVGNQFEFGMETEWRDRTKYASR
jgi:hypothetical protein